LRGGLPSPLKHREDSALRSVHYLALRNATLDVWQHDVARPHAILFLEHGRLPGQRAKLERLCRYVSRPPLAVERLALTASGQVRYLLKTPYRDGTTHIVLEPQDLMARLAALVPPPRMHLTRYHGVLAPHSSLRAAITPAQRGKGRKHAASSTRTTTTAAVGAAVRLDRTSKIISREEPAWDCRQRGGKRCGC
jgi:hypothetical protein